MKESRMGTLPKKIEKGPEGYCKICKKKVKDLKVHNKAKHKFAKTL